MATVAPDMVDAAEQGPQGAETSINGIAKVCMELSGPVITLKAPRCSAPAQLPCASSPRDRQPASCRSMLTKLNWRCGMVCYWAEAPKATACEKHES